MKEFTIKVNGLEESIKYTKLLAEGFDKVERSIVKSNIAIDTLRLSIKSAASMVDVSLVKKMNKLNSAMTETGNIFDKINKKRFAMPDWLKDADSIDSLSKKATKAIAPFEDKFNFIKSIVKDTGEEVKEEISDIKNTLADTFSDDYIKDKIKVDAEKLGQVVKGATEQSFKSVDELMSKFSAAKEVAKKLDFFDEENKDSNLKQLQANAVVKSEYDIIDYKKTKENRKKLAVELEKSREDLNKYKEYIDRTFAEETKGMDTGSEEYKKLLAEKEKALTDYSIKSEQLNLAIGKNTKDLFFSESEYMKSLADKMSEQVTNFTTSLNTGLGFMKGASEARLAMIEEELTATTEKYNKAVEARKASDAVLADLHNKSVNLSGGRSLAMQQQVDAEMAKNEELKAQEARLAAEKEKLEKKKEKETKKKKKIEIQQGIVTSIASIAQGIAKAYSLGPIVGTAMAAMLGALGAVQIATQYKQLQQIDRKADGGLLRGRRHSEGGMRIEGTNIEVEGGEYVINRRTTDHNMGLIRYINSQRRPLGEADMVSYFRSPRAVQTPPWRRQMEEGGALPVPQLAETMSRDNALLLNAIQNIRIDSRVAVTDIIRAQERMTEVDSWVGM